MERWKDGKMDKMDDKWKMDENSGRKRKRTDSADFGEFMGKMIRNATSGLRLAPSISYYESQDRTKSGMDRAATVNADEDETVDADEDEKKSDITSEYTEDDGTSSKFVINITSRWYVDEDEKKCGIAGEQTEYDGMPSTVDGDEDEKKCGNRKITITLPSSWRKLTIQEDARRRRKFGVEHSDYFRGILQRYKQTCTFNSKQNHIKVVSSRKMNAPFWNGKMACGHNGCSCQASMSIVSEDTGLMNIVFSGRIIHNSKELLEQKSIGELFQRENEVKQEESVFENIALWYLCLSQLADSNIPADGIFKACLTSDSAVEEQLPHSWKKLIVNCGNSRKLGNDFGDYFRRILEKSNKYCNFIFTCNHVKDQNSRKLNALFWNGKVKCKHVSCNCSTELFIESEHEDVVKIMFEGDIHHDLHHREANDLKGEARQKMRKKLFSSPTTPTADMYRNNLADLDADVFAAGNRGNTGTSPIVLQQVKAEIKASRCDTLPKDLVNLANKLTAEDKCLAKKFPFSKQHYFGYIHDVCVHPDLSVILMQQPLTRVYHQLVQRDILYFDATGPLVEKIPSYKRILLYTLSLRHPYGKCTPLPVGQFVSSSHTASTIATLLAKFRERERVVMNGKNAMPRLIMMDQSTAIINACLKEFSKEDLPSYINRTFRIATGRANAEDLKKVLLHICFSHIMKTTKEDVKPLLVRRKKNVKNDIRKFVMLLFARLVECRSLEEMENIIRHSFIVLTTKKRNPRVQKSLTIVEKSIAEFPQLNSLVDDTDDDEDETRDEDSEHEQC